jgi:hypothetical protein
MNLVVFGAQIFGDQVNLEVKLLLSESTGLGLGKTKDVDPSSEAFPYPERKDGSSPPFDVGIVITTVKGIVGNFLLLLDCISRHVTTQHDDDAFQLHGARGRVGSIMLHFAITAARR